MTRVRHTEEAKKNAIGFYKASLEGFPDLSIKERAAKVSASLAELGNTVPPGTITNWWYDHLRNGEEPLKPSPPQEPSKTLPELIPLLRQMADDLMGAGAEVEGLIPQVQQMASIEQTVEETIGTARKLLEQKDRELKMARDQIASVTRKLVQRSGAMVEHSSR